MFMDKYFDIIFLDKLYVFRKCFKFLQNIFKSYSLFTINHQQNDNILFVEMQAKN